MKKLGFITSEEDPELINDDKLAFAPLKALGFLAEPLIWDHSEDLDLNAFDGLIFRSCWNYHRKHELFLNFLKRLRKLKIPVFNSLDVIEWNLNKKHILEFESKLLVPKTKFIESKKLVTIEDLQAIANEWKADQLVIKPAVSLSGHDTYLMKTDSLAAIEKITSDLLKDRDVLIQEFIPEIKTSGEISLVYFDKQFSHAVRKLPAKNEFRIHREYGGTRESVVPSAQALDYGQAVLNEIKEELLYARVDLVESKNGPILIELEVTDPTLYLATSEGAPQTFAQDIANRFK